MSALIIHDQSSPLAYPSRGDTKRLIINVPPRAMKSIAVTTRSSTALCVTVAKCWDRKAPA